ncbi:MAG: glycerol-3-phosphate dehydrogenase/oxidase [Anaerolineaceae bacterium]|nr:glycerol-3-phosphate dehydrogenase/oxidase [Anaerolineaceae bacterium]
MLNKAWREKTWSELDQLWDIIVIGGGITGAGIFNMAAQKGLKVVLLEGRDFAFGTSSRSSKLVHGGIRYLRNRQFKVVRESVTERERLIRESDSLVDPLAFIFPAYQDNTHDTRLMRIGVAAYDLLGSKWQHGDLEPEEVRAALPALNTNNLVGGVKYFDSRVDDSQLVLRVINDGIRFGGTAINYAKVVSLCRAKNGKVEGIVVQDETGTLSPSSMELRGNVVINATGPWSDDLREKVDGAPKLRRLRGSHLVLPREKLPIEAAITLLHPRDNRALFAIPWEGRTIIGTTDLDHNLHEEETRITRDELTYLLEVADQAFPDYPLTGSDVIATFSGLRPIINTNAPTPSQESRAHAVWEEDGLVTVTGGKLTIFRVMAADVLNFCRDRLPNEPSFDHASPCFIHPVPQSTNDAENPTWKMMAGRLGQDVDAFFESADPDDLTPITPIPQTWAELTWGARNEAVIHLDDLMLRRVRLGLLMPQGGMAQIEKVKSLVQGPLGWSDKTWQEEVTRYQAIWNKYYAVPD